MIKIDKKLKEQKGVALVMALLILSLMMVSAVALSRIILGEVRMTVNTINSLSSFYAADSGIEKGLYYIKYARRNSTLVPFNDLLGNKYSIASGQAFTYVEATTTAPGFISYDVTTSSPAHVDIIDPSGDISNIDWDPISDPTYTHSYHLIWEVANCFPFHASDKLEITTNSFSNPGAGGFGAETTKDIVICDCNSYANDFCKDTTTYYPISDSRFYRFSFRPLNDTVKSIYFNILAYPTVGSPYDVGIASNASLIVDGAYKNSKYRLRVEIPSLGALSDAFSYVIFSEEDLSKNF